jgi:hypothetical protein
MIKITEIAEFNQLNCPLDRKREIISSKLNPSKFKIIALSNKIKPNWNISTFGTRGRACGLVNNGSRDETGST